MTKPMLAHVKVRVAMTLTPFKVACLFYLLSHWCTLKCNL